MPPGNSFPVRSPWRLVSNPTGNARIPMAPVPRLYVIGVNCPPSFAFRFLPCLTKCRLLMRSLVSSAQAHCAAERRGFEVGKARLELYHQRAGGWAVWTQGSPIVPLLLLPPPSASTLLPDGWPPMEGNRHSAMSLTCCSRQWISSKEG